MKLRISTLAVATVLVAMAVISASPAGAGMAASASPTHGSNGTSQAELFLGFGLGEERRYVLGPAENLYRGEAAMWTMRLREVLADPPHAIFELGHEWSSAEYRSQPPIGMLTSVSSSGELRVNAHGFPLDLRFRTTWGLYGLGERVYAVRYELQGGGFRKTFSMDGRDLEHPARIRRTDELDISVPNGMWAHAPMALECMFTPPPTSAGMPMAPAPGTVPNAGGGAMLGGVPLRYADEVECREPLFANPGLLSFLLPALWEAGTGELEFLMLTPAGYFGMPGLSGGGSFMGGGGGLSGGAGNRHFDSELATRAQTNSAIDDLRYIDRGRVDVGARTLDAWRFEGMRAFDAVYVDDKGVVVRVDLASAVTTDGQTRAVDPAVVPQRVLIRGDRGGLHLVPAVAPLEPAFELRRSWSARGRRRPCLL
jgi:hypothetical protein